MNWTTPADLRAQTKKLWDSGLILKSLVDDQPLFPRRLALKSPSSAQLTERFDAVRGWIGELRQAACYRVEMREVRHRVIGSNHIPAEIWIDSLDDALALIGKAREAKRFAELLALTRRRQAALLPWLGKYPLKALELALDWPRLLDVVAWVQAHPRSGVYLRQIDLPGIHSKFIETQRALLTALLDLALPAEAIDAQASGSSQFCRRYGFKDKPLRIRFRVLASDQDITLDHDSFTRLNAAVSQVFITENEINFLAFPSLPDSMVIFGAGYGFEMLAQAAWLNQCKLYYWGDIDSHGFAILDQLRSHFPQVLSLLMDRDTLMAHKSQWVQEPQPLRRDLPRLNQEELQLFNALRDNRMGVGVRLEQERIGFAWVEAALKCVRI